MNKAMLQLLRQVGNGLGVEIGDGVSLTFSYQHSGGQGLLMQLNIKQQPVSVWLDEKQYCAWTEELLPVPDFTQVPPELIAVVATWIMSPLQSGFSSAGLDSPQVLGMTPAYCEPGRGWVLAIEKEGKRLALRLIDWPLPYLSEFARQLQPIPAECQPILVPVSLVVGWLHLSLRQLRKLQEGDGLVLETICNLDDQLCLFAQRPLALCRYVDDMGGYRVEQLFAECDAMEFAQLEHENDLSNESISCSVVAEVGTIQLPLTTLAGLSCGLGIDAKVNQHHGIYLKLNGKTIARGTLLEVDENLLVRIEQLKL